MDGVSLFMMEVSEIKMTSADNFCFSSLMKASKLSEPTSSSPSIMNLTLHVRAFVSIMASKALTCMYI